MNCRDCGEPIQFLEGDRRPYDLTPRVHFANPKHIAAMRKDGATARRQPSKSGDGPATVEAVGALTDKPPGGLGFKKREAVEMMARVPQAVIDARDVAEIVREALMRSHEA